MSRKLSNTGYQAIILCCIVIGVCLNLLIENQGVKMSEKKEIKFCTSCGSDQIEVTGSKYYCSKCDVTYQVTKAGTKVIDADPLGKERARIEQCEKDIEELKGGKKQQEPPEQPNPGAEDDVNYHGQQEQEPEGFIVIE